MRPRNDDQTPAGHGDHHLPERPPMGSLDVVLSTIFLTVIAAACLLIGAAYLLG